MWRIVLALLILSAQSSAQYTLSQLREADAIVVGKVSSAPAETVHLPLRYGKDSRPDTELPMGIYEVEVLQVIKGDVVGRLRILATCSDPKQIQHRGAEEEAHVGLLPPGERMLLLLRRAQDGLILRAQSLEGDYFDAPPGVEYAVLDFWECQRRYVIPASAPDRFPLVGDYVARDVARVLARSTALKADPRAQIPAEYGFERLVLRPPAAQLTRVPKVPLPEDKDPDVPYRALVGPDPYRFYREEIIPALPPVGKDTSPLEIVSRWRVAGSWGDPDAAKKIVDAALELDPKTADPALVSALAGAVGGLFEYPNGREQAGRLLKPVRTEIPALLIAAMYNVDLPQYRADFAKTIQGFLSYADPELVRRAMAALANMYEDPEHYPVMTGECGFEAGSRNAQLLEYWRNKP